MTEKELIAKAKLMVRKTSNDVLDEDVGQLVAVALADLKRISVHQDYGPRKHHRPFDYRSRIDLYQGEFWQPGEP